MRVDVGLLTALCDTTSVGRLGPSGSDSEFREGACELIFTINLTHLTVFDVPSQSNPEDSKTQVPPKETSWDPRASQRDPTKGTPKDVKGTKLSSYNIP